MRMRLLYLFFAAAFAALPALALAAAGFSDVPANHKNAVAIQNLKDSNVISGYGDGSFKPDKTVSRAEAVAIILKAAGIETVKSDMKIPFTDVAKEDWFFPMIQKGVAMQKLKGYEDKTFRPGSPVTLPEALAMAFSFFNINISQTNVESVIYKGLAADQWYSKQAQYAKDKNIIEPDEKGAVNATDPLTRSQLAEIIYRLRLNRQTGKPFDITAGWIETEYKENFWKLRHPADWEVFKGSANSVIWKRDSAAKNLQGVFGRVWPAGAKLTITVLPNTEKLTAAQFFENIKNSYSASYGEKPVFAETNFSGRNALKIAIPKHRIADMAVNLHNGDFLIFQGEYGSAPIGEFYKKQLLEIENSYQFVEKPVEPPKPVIPLDERLATLRENILIDGKWAQAADLFPDKKLINTDAIGIGTGPVDYYFSAEANYTIKVERNSKTILNIRENQTSGF